MDVTLLKNSRTRADARTGMLARRAPGQAMVEFGLIALLLCLLFFGIFDFGMLLNGWISVTSAAREGGRQAAIGIPQTCGAGCTAPTSVTAIVNSIGIPDATGSPTISVVYCPSSSSSCTSATARDPSTLVTPYGSCTSSCSGPVSGDLVNVSVMSQLQVSTPLVRPFFQSSAAGSTCTSSSAQCLVTMGTSTTMRYEGAFVQ
jgi:Flp pilus assembly protein TadG